MATQKLLRTGIVLAVLAFIFHFIAFASPYWYKSWDRVHSAFGTIGLWHVCLNGFIMPRDPVMKSYVGCWWIHSSEFSAITMDLMPVWFRFIQAFAIFVLVGNLLAAIFSALYLVPELREKLYKNRPRMFFINSALLLGSAFLVFLIALVFAEMSNDSSWMPRPWMNHLSWSYGLCVVSGFFSAFGGMSLFVLALVFAEKEERGDPGVTSAAEMARKQRELEKQDEAMRLGQGMSMDPYPSRTYKPPYMQEGDMRRAGSNTSSINPSVVYHPGVHRREPHYQYQGPPKPPSAPSETGSQSTRVGESFV